ncbi:MAG TPA: hypothetical protein VNO50_20015 [Pyrinomonadaceae bacterium]|nr:hypothetical protein [Pyrinomonadaceae bacterium]
MKNQLQDHLRNSEDDYLWDRSGKPDPEIEKLEQVLGTLRYQPQPLVIPDDARISRPSFRRFGSRLAIAATILLAIGAGALWLNMRTREQTQLTNTVPANGSLNAAVDVPKDVIEEIPDEVPTTVSAGSPDRNVTTSDPESKPGIRQTPIRRNRPRQTGPVHQRHVPGPANPVLAANELKAAEAGKERLMLALRFASTKLNLALKKANSTNNRNLIHNQHRIG